MTTTAWDINYQLSPALIKNLTRLQTFFCAQQTFLVCSESVTSGLLSTLFTFLPNASQFFAGSLVAYRQDFKTQVYQRSFHVSISSKYTTTVIAQLQKLYQLQQTFILVTTGNAGPTAWDEQPVGKCFVGLFSPLTDKITHFEFAVDITEPTDRQKIKLIMAETIIHWLAKTLLPG